MRTLFICGVCSLGLLHAIAHAQQDENAENSSGSDRTSETIVYSTRSAAAEQLAATLLEFFDGSDIHVVAEPANNMLLLRVPSSARKEILEILEKLDRPSRSILIDLHLLKSVDGAEEEQISAARLGGPTKEVRSRMGQLEADGKLYIADSIQLTVVENQETLFQVGKTVAVVSGVTSFGGSRQVNSYQDRQVGTVVSVKAVSSDDGGIALSLQFEKSDVEQADPVAGGQQPGPSMTTSITHQTTVHLEDGNSVLAGTLVGRSNGQSTSAFLVVGAKIQDENNPVSFRSFSRNAPSSRISFGSRTGSSSPRGSASVAAPGASAPRSGTFRRGSSSSSAASSRSSVPDRYRQYAAGLVQRYDKDGDNKLNAKEREPMSRNYADADTNNDGFISIDELLKALPR